MIKINEKILNFIEVDNYIPNQIYVNDVIVWEIIRLTITAEVLPRGKIEFTFLNKGNRNLNVYITEDNRDFTDSEIMAKKTLTVRGNSSETFVISRAFEPEDYHFFVNNGLNWKKESLNFESDDSSSS